MKYYTYILLDPRTFVVRYVGASLNPENRLYSHVKNTSGITKKKKDWIKELTDLELTPIMEITGCFDKKEHAAAHERELYSVYDEEQIFGANPTRFNYTPPRIREKVEVNVYITKFAMDTIRAMSKHGYLSINQQIISILKEAHKQHEQDKPVTSAA